MINCWLHNQNRIKNFEFICILSFWKFRSVQKYNGKTLLICMTFHSVELACCFKIFWFSLQAYTLCVLTLSEPGTTIACSPNSPQRFSYCLHPQTAQDIWSPSWQVLTKTANLRSKRVVLLHNDLLYHAVVPSSSSFLTMGLLCSGQEIYLGFGSTYTVPISYLCARCRCV